MVRKLEKECSSLEYEILTDIFKTKSYRSLPGDYKKRFRMVIGKLQDGNLDYLEVSEALHTFRKLFQNKELENSKKFFFYLDFLFFYPTFPLLDSLFVESEKDFLYLKIEAKLCELEDGFLYVREEFEDIVKNEKLRELGFTEVVLNGILNSPLPKYDLVEDISYLLAQKENYLWLILKLFQAPNPEYNYLVFSLLDDKEVTDDQILEMVDMIYATPIEEFENLKFHITHKLIYEEMSFKDACRNYFKEAMKILDESDHMKSNMRVRIPVYKTR